MKKFFKKLFSLTALFSVLLFLLNKFIHALATVKNLLRSDDGSFYEWKYGNIYYQKEGSGPALLLVHDLRCDSSSYDFSRLVRPLSEHYTVYTLDLLGCGRSDRPNLTYTNFLYVQLLECFIRDVIKQPVIVASAGQSVPFALLASRCSDLITEEIFINPQSFRDQSRYPDKNSKLVRLAISLPVFGTAYYNFQFCYQKILGFARETYFASHGDMSAQYINTCYESAHLMKSSGRFLYASLASGYTNMNIAPMVSSSKIPLHLIVGKEAQNAGVVLEQFKQLNDSIDSCILPYAKQIPQFERPDQTAKAFFKLLQVSE
ncbi:MAG: alpha/beta fold hydrolase [Lachnospiraceae bacterium]